MRLTSYFIAALIITLIATEVMAKETKETGGQKDYTCTIHTGYFSAKGHGSSKKKALEEARLDCGNKMIDLHFSRHKQVDTSEVAELSVRCVNLECQ